MPFYRRELTTNLPAESAIARIKAAVGPAPSGRRMFRRSVGQDVLASPPFVGTVEGDRFRVRRDITYRNSFLPVVSGRVVNVPSGVRVSVTMYLQPAIAVFMLVWFCGVGAATVVAIPRLLIPCGHVQLELFILPAMLVFAVVLVGCGFFPEALKARRLLEQVLRT